MFAVVLTFVQISQALGVKSVVVRGVVDGTGEQGPRYDAGVVRDALARILA